MFRNGGDAFGGGSDFTADGEVTIRRAGPGDLAAIAGIQARSPEMSVWDPAGYLDYDCRIAVSDGRVAGFLVTREVGPGEWEILNVAVDPAYRRKGLAQRLIQGELSGRTGAWFLEVRESNAAAISLYKGLGFREAGRRKNYYKNPAETAIVMRFLS
jgi:ribosomal-protein-alanine N-acetyltransferase